MNGLCIQWGKHIRTSSGWITVDFPLKAQYTEYPIVLAIPTGYDNSGSIAWKNTVTEVYKTGFRYNNNGQSSQSWIAIGY